MAGYSFLDKMRREDTRKGQEIYKSNDNIQQYINRWLSHAERMEQ